MESRIEALESKLSMAEDLLDTLNLTVFRQQQQIDQLHKQLRALVQLQAQNAATAPEQPNAADEIPPHY